MTDPQFELVTLTVTHEEARMIATALSTRALMEYVPEGFSPDEKIAQRYNDLRRKVEYQSGASDKP